MPTKNKTTKMQKSIAEIAGCLVKNHLRNSLEPSEWDKLIKENILTEHVERRVIAVVGAGASRSVGIPLASEALLILKDKAIMPNVALEAELDRLSQTYNLDRNTFETNLRALSASAFDAQKLRDNLQAMYNHKFMPVLGYEILAHMIKHRFLDAIINFNFDELLDQSIEDELDAEEYYNILSDGDCPDESELRENTPELPFYIKPHGTASHKSTLRFTREDYYGVPLDIQRVIRYLLTDKPVVLLIIGFGMQSLEFNRILESAKPGSMMFHINLNNPVKKDAYRSFRRNELLNAKVLGDVSEAIKKIWDEVASAFLPEYLPRDITRHILVSRTFFREVDKNDVEKYLRGRTVIELCLSIAKCKGLVNMSQLSSDRSGKYFDYYKTFNVEANFYEICRKIGLKDIGYSRESMRLTKGENQTPRIVKEKDFDAEIDFLYNNVQDNLDPDIRDQLHKDLFRNTLLDLYRGWEVELRYYPGRPYARIFRFPRSIPTITTLKFHTDQILKKDWSHAFFVVETGEFLTAQNIVKLIREKCDSNPELKMYLIVADLSWKDELKRVYGDIIVDIKKLPWWEHNRHMTVLANKNFMPFASIYFSRRMRSANIFPVLLDNIDDTLAVLESFNAYWIKASWYTENKIEEENIWISAAEAKKFDNLFNTKGNKRKKR